MADSTLNAAARSLLGEPVLAHLATVSPDGTPHVTPVWIDVDGDDLVVNTVDGRVKARHVRRTPKVGISVVDPADAYRVVALEGTVVDITDEGAREHIDQLAKKYLGVDEYPMHQPGDVRLKVRIRPDRVVMQPSG